MSSPRLPGAFKIGSDHKQPHQIKNTILLGLPSRESELLLKNLEYIEMDPPFALHEAGEPLKFAYFINSGLASVLTVMEDSKSVEVGLAGTEGFIGMPLVAGLSSSSTRVIMQVGGSAYRISAKNFTAALTRCPSLVQRLTRYNLELGLQSMHVAACNRLHEVDERLARWLLMSQDRLGGDLVPLTQDFLAHMLGTRRASVTVAAGILQRAGLITYNRGHVQINDRAGLENSSCECYASMQQQLRNWEKEAKSPALRSR
jgi:CRP-like cAMP-binding protein